MYGTNVGQIYYDVTLDTASMVNKSREVNRAVDGIAAKFNAITAAVKVFAAALALVKAAQLADDMRMLGARVEVAAGSLEKGAQALDELRKISGRTQTELAANAGVFNRLNQSLLQMGGTQQDTLQLTELLGKAIKVSGASGVEASSAMMQFGQALGSGKLAGDELRSLLENAPYLMRQLADGLGVPIGALRQMGEEGKLTADVVVAALKQASTQIDSDFRRLPQTLSSAMAVASDAAARLTSALDGTTGSSAVMAGAVKGAGDALDTLAQQFEEANRQATGLSRSEQVRTWADATRLALSYVADAADVTWQTLSVLGRNVRFVFETLGTQIGGIGAMAAAVARGDLAQARAIWTEMASDDAARRAELDKRDAETMRGRKTWGEQMRDTWRLAAQEDRGFTPAGAGSGNKLRGGSSGGDQKERGRFDAEAYLAGLEEKTKEGVERIDLIEQEALRKNAELLKAGKINREQAAQAATLIEARAMEERRSIWFAEAEERRAWIEKQGEEEARQRERQAQTRARGQEFAQGIIGASDPIAALQMELQRKSDLLSQYAAADQANADLYAQARVELERQTQERITAIRERDAEQRAAMDAQSLQLVGRVAGDTYAMLKQAGKERTALAKSVFLAERALAVATIIMNTEVAASKAGAQLGIFGIPMAAMIRATGYASAGLVAGQALGEAFGGGRQYGGPAYSGSLYRVNEAGRPEMFQAANGAQYMLPTRDGRVIPEGAAAGGAPTLELRVVNMHPTAAVQQRTGSDGRPEIVIAEVASQITERRGPVWRALSGSTNVRGAQ